jgi:L-iditol 2-dehydrogenase
MRVAMYYNNKDIRIEKLPKPKINADEILMEVKASGICGTDLLEWYRLKKAPLVLGHEVSGIVQEVGDKVKDFKIGDRIVAAHHVPCNECHYCQRGHQTVCDTLRKTNFYPGGFAQYIRLPQINIKTGVFLLSDNVSFEEATFVEPLGCVMRGQRSVNLRPPDSVLVMGSGISGLLHISLAKINGVGKIFATDVQENRLKAAGDFGADKVFNAKDYSAQELRNLNSGRLADLVIVCSGAISAFKQALHSVERGGTILFFAAADPAAVLPITINELFWRNEVSLISSYGASPTDYRNALELISKKEINLSKMISHRLSLQDIKLGFQLVAEAKESLKVIIAPQE